MTDRVALLGAGAMGGPMARVLYEAGVQVTAFDPDTARTDALRERGVRCADTAAAAAAGADVVLVVVATAAHAETALFGGGGDGGAVETMATGGAVVVMSTIGPEAMRQLAERLAASGLRIVDAPLSGGVARATDGSLLVMVGADQATFERVEPVLDVVGGRVVRVGDAPGDGQSVKLVNQLLCGVHIAAAAEALAFADRLGLDVANVWEVVRTGAAASFMLDDRGGRMARREFEPVNSAVQIFTKDLGLVTSAASGGDFPARLAETAHRMFTDAAEHGLARHDDSELFAYLLGREA